MRVLIVEDNRSLAEQMQKGLLQSGIQSELAYTGMEGEEKAYVNGYDAILLDLNLPDKDGLDILKFLRDSQVNTPVIVITARDEIEERARGLDSGADDYVVKPFQLLELKSRIQAVVRRFHGRTSPEIQVGALTVNPCNRTVTYEGKPLSLKTKEFDILEYIARCHPAVVSSEEIAEHVYGEEYDPFSSVLRVHLSRLKKNLREAAGTEFLTTIRGKGYCLVDSE